MTPYPHQLALAETAYDVLVKSYLVYLAMEERTGKTLTAILVAERTKAPKRILVLTKKNALAGWAETLAAYAHNKEYTVTNYHQAKKLGAVYDLIILDEAHNYISAFPKRSSMWAAVKKLTQDKPIIYMSATPAAQGPQLFYNQFALSSWSPFKEYSTGYNWFAAYGVPNPVYLAGRAVEQYNRCHVDKVTEVVTPYLITATRKGLGFSQEPTDKLHYVVLGDLTRQAYNQLLKHQVLNVKAGELVCDTPMKLRTALHMLEGGVLKLDDYVELGNTEKIDYIKQVWGDTEDLVIMYNYIAEGRKLFKAFRHAQVLQATSYAEGVDLSHKKHLVIYSQDFSTARHSQRRARQANKRRTAPITVHFLLVKDAVSEQVYTTVTQNKTNFVDSTFERVTL